MILKHFLSTTIIYNQRFRDAAAYNNLSSISTEAVQRLQSGQLKTTLKMFGLFRPRNSKFFHFIIGFLTGVVFIKVFSSCDQIRIEDKEYAAFEFEEIDSIKKGEIIRKDVKNGHVVDDIKMPDFSEVGRPKDDDYNLANELYQKVRIMCLVSTHPANHKLKAVHIQATWGKRCNKLVFVSTKNDTESGIPIEVVVDSADGHDFVGLKTKAVFEFAYRNYVDEFDWFLRADDDTYVIVENLRYFLSAEEHNRPVYFGYWFLPFVKQGYYSGGAGYVLSKEALRRFGKRDISNDECNKIKSGKDDLEFGRCMESLGVKTTESLDASGRSRFHCFSLDDHLNGRFPDWFVETPGFVGYDKYQGKKMGVKWMSDYAISFHYVTPEKLYHLEYFVYHLHPYGIVRGLQEINRKTYIQ